MLSIEKCKRMLNKNGYNYTGDEAKKVRDFLHFIVEMEYEYYSNLKKGDKAIIDPQETENDSENQ